MLSARSHIGFAENRVDVSLPEPCGVDVDATLWTQRCDSASRKVYTNRHGDLKATVNVQRPMPHPIKGWLSIARHHSITA
jgi:hypothetical protein